MVALFGALAASGLSARQRLVMVSVDGLDERYLRDCDALGLRIPNLRRLMKEGAWADGVVGEVPTITWPEHTTLLTGVPPSVHGIQANQMWNYSLIRVKTLWTELRAENLTSAAITWPVTVDAPITWNLPETFEKRQGGAMDLAAIAKKATPGLIAEIAEAYPSFPQQWMDDRTRTLAAMYLIQQKHPDFLAVHLVDLDAEEHDTEPFSTASKAMLEYTDELIGKILAVLPKDAAFALVSDHGFVRVEKTVHPAVGTVTPFWVTAANEGEAAELDKLRQDPGNGIGRLIPAREWSRFMPGAPRPVAAYEPADGFVFSPKAMETRYGKPYEVGDTWVVAGASGLSFGVFVVGSGDQSRTLAGDFDFGCLSAGPGGGAGEIGALSVEGRALGEFQAGEFQARKLQAAEPREEMGVGYGDGMSGRLTTRTEQDHDDDESHGCLGFAEG